MPFICTIDTVFGGRVASWRDEDERPVVHETREAAEEEANDSALDEPDGVLEVVVTEDRIYDPIDGRTYWFKVTPGREDWRLRFDREAKRLYCVTAEDMGMSWHDLAELQDGGEDPEAAVRRLGEKHGLLERVEWT